MGFQVKIEGTETIQLMEENLTIIEFGTEIPLSSHARSTDLSVVIYIEGKILVADGQEDADETSKIARWSLVPVDNHDCYRKVTITVLSESQVVRQITLPNAFVIKYSEDFMDGTGTGEFILSIKQRKDKLASLDFEGGFDSE